MSPNPDTEHPFKRVANELRVEIIRGDYAPGDKLPSENELKDRFGVTRATVRKGIALLRSEGHVVSQQGKGAYVRQRPQISMHQVGTIYRERRATGVSNYNAEAAAQGQDAKQIIREVAEVPAPDDVARLLEVDPGAPVLVRRRLFTIDGNPMQTCDGYYELSMAGGTRIAEERAISGGVHAVIEDPEGPIQRRIVQFVEDLDIRMPYPHEAKQLDIPDGVPLARVMRTAYDSAGKPLEVLDSRVPCDRHIFRYVIEV